MKLASGVRLGPYEIQSALGAGGMGEVYRARDTRLERSVAIKVLSGHHRLSPEHRRRFLREARAVAALSHPNIGALHDVGEHEGTDFLVLELLDGETLASRLARGPMTVPEAIACAVQIAQALQHAHQLGIVHRDLKPQNVMLTKSGVKLLDFGLARLTLPTVEGDGTTSPETLTVEGAVLGTLPYMAPEQLEGAEADARSDLFAFGAVLYEMLGGRRAFDGKARASIIGAVLNLQPPPLATLQPRIPPALDRVVRACLEKDPDRRFRSAFDVQLALLWVREDDPVLAGPPPPRARSRSRLVVGAAAIAVAAAAATALAMLWSGVGFRAAPGADPVRFSVAAPDGHRVLEPILSPDGRHLVMLTVPQTGPRTLWLHSFDAGTGRQLAGTEGAANPFWSPDSRSIAFFARGKLKRVDIAGGAPIVIADAENGRGGTWNQQDVILFAPTPLSGLARVSASGGEPTPVTKIAEGEAHRWPQFLPDGDSYMYLAFSAQDPTRSELRADSLASPRPATILNATTEGRYADGFLLFVRDGQLLAQPFDPDRRVLRGDPRALFSAPFALQAGRYSFSVSGTGAVAVQHSPAVAEPSRLTWLGRDGKALGTIGEAGLIAFPSIAPDQRRVAAQRSQDGADDIWIFDAPAWAGTRVTSRPLSDIAPVWSPDGGRIAYGSFNAGGGGTSLTVLVADRPQTPSVVHSGPFTLRPGGWSRDGWIVFQLSDTRGLQSLWMAKPDGRQEPVAFRNDAFNYIHPAISPDGRWIAYAADLSGELAIYVDSFPASGRPRIIPDSIGGREPRWRLDGQELYYLSASDALVAVPRTRGDTPVFGSPRSLFTLRLPRQSPLAWASRHYDVARDGRFLAVITEAAAPAASPPATVVLNATAGLRRTESR